LSQMIPFHIATHSSRHILILFCSLGWLVSQICVCVCFSVHVTCILWTSWITYRTDMFDLLSCIQSSFHIYERMCALATLTVCLRMTMHAVSLLRVTFLKFFLWDAHQNTPRTHIGEVYL
jgi:hypothetical protein